MHQASKTLFIVLLNVWNEFICDDCQIIHQTHSFINFINLNDSDISFIDLKASCLE